MKAVEFKDVWEKYRIKFIRDRAVTWDEFWALKNINFEVQKGKILGVIGENGAGKTTLLKLIAGMIVPDRGEVKTQGKISSLMELGAGFHPELTGRENIYLNANLYGFSKEEMDKKIGEIINFVGIAKFIDAPIKYYSQGMYVRLAFALAVHVEPDIFLIDDILAVGDEEAQRKCLNKIFELKEMGKTIVLVSHDMNMVHKLCDRMIFLKGGRLIKEGSPGKVVSRYLETVGENKGIGELEKGDLRLVFNNGKVLINWEGLPLTKHFGGYFALYHSETQTTYLSINADWEVSKSGENEILAKGVYHYLPVRQTWKIKLEDEKQFTPLEKDSSIFDDGIKNKVVFCSPITLFAVLAVIRQAVDNFTLEQTSNEILSLLGAFKKQWGMFLQKLKLLGKRIEDTQTEYSELTNLRQRQLEKPLNKIEYLRTEHGLPVAEDEDENNLPAIEEGTGETEELSKPDFNSS